MSTRKIKFETEQPLPSSAASFTTVVGHVMEQDELADEEELLREVEAATRVEYRLDASRTVELSHPRIGAGYSFVRDILVR